MSDRPMRWRFASQQKWLTENPDKLNIIRGRCVTSHGPLNCSLYKHPSEKHPADTYAKISIIENGRLRPEYVHRVVYALVKGDIPVGYEVTHECQNKRCVNPDHLSAMSPDDHKRADKNYRDYVKENLKGAKPNEKIYAAIKDGMAEFYQAVKNEESKHSTDSRISPTDEHAIRNLTQLESEQSDLGFLGLTGDDEVES